MLSPRPGEIVPPQPPAFFKNLGVQFQSLNGKGQGETEK